MKPTTANVEQVGQALLEGKLVAYPTEAVWGLGCNPFDQQAVNSLLQLKNRPVEKGLILVAASFDQVAPYLADNIPSDAIKRLKQPSTMPVTWLVPFKKEKIPHSITGEHSTVAIRICQHPVVQALCNCVNMPVVSTSANPQGKEPALDALQVQHYFGNSVTICEGEIGSYSQPSTIKDLLTGIVVRD